MFSNYIFAISKVYGSSSDAAYIEDNKQCLHLESSRKAKKLKEIAVDVKIMKTTRPTNNRRTNVTNISVWSCRLFFVWFSFYTYIMFKFWYTFYRPLPHDNFGGKELTRCRTQQISKLNQFAFTTYVPITIYYIGYII